MNKQAGRASGSALAPALTLNPSPQEASMATAKVASFGTLYKGYIARLKALGCTFCPTCYCYVTHAPNSCASALRKAA